MATVATTVPVASSCGDDDSAPTTTDGEPTETTEQAGADAADRSIYGVDLSGVDLPAADPYEGYETIEDDSAQVEIAVPTAWEDVDTSKAERDGVEIPGVWASTDLDTLNNGYSVAGLQVDLRTASSEDKLFELLNSDNATADVCSGPETFDYDDGLYTGTAELWTDCTEDGAALLELVALRDGNQYVTLEIQMLTDADVDAAIAALEGFTAVEVDAAQTWTPDAPPSETEAPNTQDTKPPQIAPPQKAGTIFTLAIADTNPSAGDNWQVVNDFDTEVVTFLYEDYEPDDPLAAGGSGTSYFSFRAVAPGTTTITLADCFGCPEEATSGNWTVRSRVQVTVEP